MSGIMRLLGKQVSGTGLLALRSDELLGMLVANPTTLGVGHVNIYEDDANGVQIAHTYSNIYLGQVVVGPFQHTSKRIWYIVTGTGVSVDIYAWSDGKERRSQF